jgi:4-diphosphocytidyl-2-C-methyl-D-erythritol kinase
MRNNYLKSYAKINLALNVTGKRNSMHKIESIISFIDLHDLISIQNIKSNNHKISFYGKFSKNIKRENTVQKLLDLLDRSNLLKNKKFKISIKKNIPQEAGLGGGSMNAAAILNFFIKKKNYKTQKNKDRTTM